MSVTIKARIALLGLLLATAAGAQDAGNDQADVWAVVESQWNAEETGEDDWMDDLLIEEFAGWSTASPAPRNRASTKMWDRVMADAEDMKAHELYPLSIIVRGDVAVAHYLYTTATADKQGDMTLANGRFTDVLVRTDDGWKFLAWHGGKTD